MAESIYNWIKAPPPPVERPPLYQSRFPGDAPVPNSTLREAAVVKPVGVMGREVADSVRPEAFLKAHEKTGAPAGDDSERESWHPCVLRPRFGRSAVVHARSPPPAIPPRCSARQVSAPRGQPAQARGALARRAAGCARVSDDQLCGGQRHRRDARNRATARGGPG
jgi:hypothetical protein